MDFDHRFRKSEFRRHLESLDINLTDEAFNTLLERTTKNTRTGQEFSFKPIGFAFGNIAQEKFHVGYSCDQFLEGQVNPKVKKEYLSSFWIKLARSKERFEFRLYCENGVPGLCPFKGQIYFRDVIPGEVQLRACPSEDQQYVTSYLTITTRRPLHLGIRIPDPYKRGEELITDRQATEADFVRYCDEADAGSLSPFGSSQAIVHPGIWFTLRLNIRTTLRQYKLLWMCMARLRKKGLKPDFSRPHLDPHEWRSLASSSLDSLATFSFELQYAISVVISNGIVRLPEFPGFIGKIAHLPDEQKLMVLNSMYSLGRSQSVEQQIKDTLAGDIATSKRQLPSYCVLVHRCLITPLRVILQPPQVETENSVLHHWRQYCDRFLRIHFVSEDGPLQVNFNTVNFDSQFSGQQGIFARIRRTLKYGLDIAGRHYSFFSFGESQIKEQGCWMIAEEPPSFTRSALLGWMGNLDEEKVVAKHAARQGLAFSTTRSIGLQVLPSLEDDIECMSNGKRYIFTDGAGRCSHHFAQACAAALGLHDYKLHPPSAVQARMPGCKGVFCVDPQLQGNAIVLRRSMVKFSSESLVFDANNSNFRVLKVSDYSPAFLNRQSILLLEDLGVHADILVEMFAYERSRVDAFDKGTNPAPYWPNMPFPVDIAIQRGFGRDPFIQNMTQLLKCRTLSDLKWKARIHIPQGAFLMGVPDDSRNLPDGKIFCQITDPESGLRKVVKGKCVLYRNPCLHPGDVRLVEAVDVAALHHLCNVVAFPTSGQRDLANMLAGGDLDGDFYTVTWDERLFFESNFEPADYTAPPSPQVVNVEEDDTKKFYVDFIMNNILGQIDNAHLAYADQEGPSSEGCLYLVEQHNIAIDFFKTGVMASRTAYSAPKKWPDFMGKRGEKQYESMKALGRMFRMIDPEPTYKNISKPDPNYRVPLPDGLQIPAPYWAAVKRMKMQYDQDMRRIMKSNGLTSDAECVAGLSLQSIKRRLRKEKDYDRDKMLRESYERLVNEYRNKADAFIANNPLAAGDEDWTWAFACYEITFNAKQFQQREDLSREGAENADEDEEDLYDIDLVADEVDTETTALFSFPWLYHQALLR